MTKLLREKTLQFVGFTYNGGKTFVDCYQKQLSYSLLLVEAFKKHHLDLKISLHGLLKTHKKHKMCLFLESCHLQ